MHVVLWGGARWLAVCVWSRGRRVVVYRVRASGRSIGGSG